MEDIERLANEKLAQEYFRKAKEDLKKLENLPKEKQDTRVLRTMYRYFLSIYNSKEYSKCIREIEEYMQSKNGEKVESNFYWILSSCYVKVKTKLSLQKAFDLFFYSIQPGSIAITGENTWGWQFPAQQLKIKTIPCAISHKKYKWVYQSNRPIPKHLMTKFIPE